MAEVKPAPTIGEASDVKYEFPKSENISIQRSSLQIQLEKFKKAVAESFSFDSIFSLLITLAAVWVPVFTSNFRKILTISSETILGAYILFSIYVFYKNIVAPLISFFRNRKNKISSDAEKMSKYILEQCNKKK
jgi:hypothetical protein